MFPSNTPHQEAKINSNELPPVQRIYSDQDLFFDSGIRKNYHWSVSWSDLMMTMFILFLVLYVYHKANKNFSIGEKAERLNEDTAGVASDVFSKTDPDRFRLDTLKLEYSEDISSVDLARDKTVRIVLPGDLLFDPGQIKLKQRALESLAKIAKIIGKTSYVVNVVGHTDNLPITGSYSTNWELSVIRACTVARYLIEEMKIDGNRVFVTGHAEYMPIRPNNSRRNRASNRRVEIILTREKPFMPEDVWNKIQ